MSQGFATSFGVDTDVTLAANSNLLVPSQKAIKTYVDNEITAEIAAAATTTFPATTGASGVQWHTASGTNTLAALPSGQPAWPVAPYKKRVSIAQANENSTTISNMALITAVGSSGGAVTSARAISTGSVQTEATRIYEGVPNVSGNRQERYSTLQWFFGNAAGRGGFYAVFRFGFDATFSPGGNQSTFIGFRTAAGTLPGNVEPSTYLNCFGVSNDSSETTLYAVMNDGAGNCTRTDLGASFPSTASGGGVLYELHLACNPNATTVYYFIINRGTGATASGSLSGDLPAVNTLFGVSMVVRNTTNAQRGFEWGLVYVESDV